MNARILIALLLATFAYVALAAPDQNPTTQTFDLRDPWVMGTWSMLWAGQLLQLTQLLSKLEDMPDAPSFAWWFWIKTHPFTMFKQVIAAQVCYTLLAAIPGQMTVSSAFAVGYMANDWATRAATRTASENRVK